MFINDGYSGGMLFWGNENEKGIRVHQVQRQGKKMSRVLDLEVRKIAAATSVSTHTSNRGSCLWLVRCNFTTQDFPAQ
jgi:hypothetical protein